MRSKRSGIKPLSQLQLEASIKNNNWDSKDKHLGEPSFIGQETQTLSDLLGEQTCTVEVNNKTPFGIFGEYRF